MQFMIVLMPAEVTPYGVVNTMDRVVRIEASQTRAARMFKLRLAQVQTCSWHVDCKMENQVQMVKSSSKWTWGKKCRTRIGYLVV
ncbi:uncharacterized protein LOC127097445 isoform X2 [Lathyrus oleraceus]|nr:uncharacterized protein LOC127097445 isoform X2 [Pisum sativum]